MPRNELINTRDSNQTTVGVGPSSGNPRVVLTDTPDLPLPKRPWLVDLLIWLPLFFIDLVAELWADAAEETADFGDSIENCLSVVCRYGLMSFKYTVWYAVFLFFGGLAFVFPVFFLAVFLDCFAPDDSFEFYDPWIHTEEDLYLDEPVPVIRFRDYLWYVFEVVLVIVFSFAVAIGVMCIICRSFGP